MYSIVFIIYEMSSARQQRDVWNSSNLALIYKAEKIRIDMEIMQISM